LVLVSEYEGFGLPLLEAFSYNLPVLASNIPILKEVGQSACLFVDPKSPLDIAQGLEKITQDNGLRQDLITQGQLRLKDFSWQTCTDQTLKILNAS
jgi:glycosyltransferase involved in cell wall biosynthesis